MTDDQIKHMVNRFLGWQLPKPWHPDNGISYARPNYAHEPTEHDWPTGTNLFDADQAETLVRYMLEGLPDLPIWADECYRDGQQSRQPEIDALKKLVYVPGLWRCPKCEFSLLQSNLNAVDGTVTARDYPGDKCPNCNSPLWRVTERQAGNDVADRCEEQMRRAVEAEAKIDALRAALDESVKLQSHYADLLNMYDGGQRIIFKSTEEWLERLTALESKGNPNAPKT